MFGIEHTAGWMSRNRKTFSAAKVAEGAMDRCCEGDPWPTLRNLLRFQFALWAIALERGVMRLKTQPAGIYRCRSNPKYGGRGHQ